MRRTAWRLLSYGAVMAVGTGLDVLAVTSLLRAAVWPVVAVSVGFALNVSSGYLLSRYVVFRAPRVPPGTSVLRYGALVGLNVLVAVGGVSFAVSLGVPYVMARLVSSGCLVPTNYVIMHRWVFDDGQPAIPAKRPPDPAPSL